MRREPGFNFSKEFAGLDKGLQGSGPYLAAGIVFVVVFIVQGFFFYLYQVRTLLLMILEDLELDIDVLYLYFIIPGIAAVFTFFRGKRSQGNPNPRFQGSARDVKVAFYDDPDQPMPEYRPRHNEREDDQEEPPDEPNA